MRGTFAPAPTRLARRAWWLIFAFAFCLACDSDEDRAIPEAASITRALSGDTPFPNGCGVPGQQTVSSEAEPTIAVNPLDPRNIVAVWQQDRFAIDGGALSNVAAVSKDGGESWQTILIHGLSRCTGPATSDERTSDPWLSFGPDGKLYLASLTFSEQPTNSVIAGPTKLVVSTSGDGGLTWDDPVDVQPFDLTYNDREAITADPSRTGYAYYAFVKRLGAFGESGIEMFSRTTDGGKTWSTPAPILLPLPGTLPDPTLIVALPNGTVLNLALIANLTPFLPDAVPRVPWVVVGSRSTDAGNTWSLPTTIATLVPAAPVDPDSGKIVRGYNLISAAAGPDGTAYVAWNEIESTSSSAIRFSKTTDGGLTWQAPATVTNVNSQAFVPTLAVSGDGTVGVAYYDFRNDRKGDNELTTDIWFSFSRDGGLSWRESHLAGPFDILTAPETESSGVAGLFVGDYEGMTGLPGAEFAGVFTVSRPLASHGPSDIIFARIDAGALR
jgi:hypothetical protein